MTSARVGEAFGVLDELVAGDADLRGDGDRERGFTSPAPAPVATAARADTFCADMARRTCSAEPERDAAPSRVPPLERSLGGAGAIGAVDVDLPGTFEEVVEESTCSCVLLPDLAATRCGDEADALSGRLAFEAAAALLRDTWLPSPELVLDAV